MSKFRMPAIAVLLTVTLAACSSSAEDGPSISGAPSATSGDAPPPATEPSETADDSQSDEAPQDAPEGGNYTSDDVGNATLYVDGVEYTDFVGDCEIARNSGREDIGDLNDGDISAIIAVDNVEAHEESSMSYVAINEESFTFRDPQNVAGDHGPRAKGEISTMTELSPRTADGSRDIVQVRFAGALEDGTTLDADIVCELQNAF